MKNINYIFRTGLTSLMVLVFIFSGCDQKPKPPENAQKVFLDNEEMIRAKIDSVKKQTQAMSDEELIRRLEFDSEREREPFNSIAFREITERDKFKSDLLIESIKQSPNKKGFLSLLALRKIERKSYEEMNTELKIPVLINALAEAKMANSWGIPHLYLEDGSKAILETGEGIIPALTELLGNCKDMEIWGSEEMMVFKEYGYRKCDFALFFIMQIKNEYVDFPIDPQRRDRLIQNLKEQDD